MGPTTNFLPFIQPATKVSTTIHSSETFMPWHTKPRPICDPRNSDSDNIYVPQYHFSLPMLLYKAHSWVLLLHWVPLALIGLVWSLVSKLKTKTHRKREITLFKIVSHYQKGLHQSIFKSRELTVRNLHPYTGYSTKAKGKRHPFPTGREATIFPLFYLLHILVRFIGHIDHDLALF